MSDTKINELLEDWNWNASVSRLMTKCYNYFNNDRQIKDLAEHLRVDTSSWA